VVREFGPMRRVTGVQITNEVNIAFSPNTSDGAYRRSVETLVLGVVAAKRESLRHGYHHQKVGFNFAWRFVEEADAGFWEALGRRGGRRLRRHTDWVGIDIYPASWTPGVFFPAPIVDFGDAFWRASPEARVLHAQGRLRQPGAPADRGDRLRDGAGALGGRPGNGDG
jgi:hypothetical protein